MIPGAPPGPASHTPKDDTYDRPEPKSADLIAADPATVLPWELVREYTRLYWLATVHPTARPHVRRPHDPLPVLTGPSQPEGPLTGRPPNRKAC